MSAFDFFDGILVINMDQDVAKWVMFMDQAVRYGIADKVIRVSGIKKQKGSYGCALAHKKCLDIARNKKWNNVLIFEDDVKFLYSKEYIEDAVTAAVRSLKYNKEWDLFYIGQSMREPIFHEIEGLEPGDITRSDAAWFGRFAYAVNNSAFGIFDNMPKEDEFTTENRGDVLLSKNKKLVKYVMWPSVASVFTYTSATDPGRIKDVGLFLEDKYEKYFMADSVNLGSSMFQGIQNCCFDFAVVISSFDRYESLIRIVNQIRGQTTKHTFHIFILNDGSSDKRYSDLSSSEDFTILHNAVNCGKQKYWFSISKLFNAASKYQYSYLVQIDDDFILGNNFLDEVMRLFLENKTDAIHYHINNNDKDRNRWGMTCWVDGGVAMTRAAMNAVGHRIGPVAASRWDTNPELSSGVWHTLSNQIRTKGITVIKPDITLAVHCGNSDSKMNPDIRAKHKIYSKY